jgi:hypothetical protein
MQVMRSSIFIITGETILYNIFFVTDPFHTTPQGNVKIHPPSPLGGIGANLTFPPFHLPHPHPNPPLEGEGII